MKKLIAQGAEAKIYFEDSKELEGKTILKNRIPKSYRHPEIDKQIIKRRTKRELKILEKAKSLNINVPTPWTRIGFNPNEIRMSFIPGDRLSETLNSYPKAKQLTTMKKIAEQISLLHDNDIIHGDLTTSNIILSKEDLAYKSASDSSPKKGGTRHSRVLGGAKSEKLFIIDFGLGQISKKIEDKAVDIHLLKQALEAKHFQNWQDLFKEFEKNYKSKEKKKILMRLTAVEKRGRYRH